jgi:hypothetical protein
VGRDEKFMRILVGNLSGKDYLRKRCKWGYNLIVEIKDVE